MDVVDRAVLAPGECLLTGQTDGPFFDLGSECPHIDPRRYVAVAFVEELARKHGMVPREELEQRDREIALLRDQIADADRFAEAAEYTLGKFGQHVRSKPGRKPGRREAA